jgi:hypothetical protein
MRIAARTIAGRDAHEVSPKTSGAAPNRVAASAENGGHAALLLREEWRPLFASPDPKTGIHFVLCRPSVSG